MKITFYGPPVTKKNSQRLITLPNGRMIPIPSKAYKNWEKECLKQVIGKHRTGINTPINLMAVIFKKDLRKSDLANYLAAVCDMLVKAGVIEDDNFNIVAGHDGSRISLDRKNPRVEITITDLTVDSYNL